MCWEGERILTESQLVEESCNWEGVKVKVTSLVPHCILKCYISSFISNVSPNS